MIKMILASTEDGGIGLDNELPFHCPEDLQYFKEQTEGSIVIMGRKTFDSLPFKNGLPNRGNIVVTHNHTFSLPSEVVPIKIWAVKNFINNLKSSVYIIGGKSLYEQLFHLVEEVHHTTVKGDYECDTFIDTSMWEGSVDWKLKEVKTLGKVAEVKIWRKC